MFSPIKLSSCGDLAPFILSLKYPKYNLEGKIAVNLNYRPLPYALLSEGHNNALQTRMWMGFLKANLFCKANRQVSTFR